MSSHPHRRGGWHLAQELASARGAAAESEALEARRQALCDQEHGLSCELGELDAAAIRIGRHLERLRRPGPSNWIARVLRFHGVVLARDQQLLQSLAVLRFVVRSELTFLDLERRAVEARAQLLADATTRYGQLIEDKARWIAARGGPLAEELERLEGEGDRLRAQSAELGRVLRAAQGPGAALEGIHRELVEERGRIDTRWQMRVVRDRLPAVAAGLEGFADIFAEELGRRCRLEPQRLPALADRMSGWVLGEAQRLEAVHRWRLEIEAILDELLAAVEEVRGEQRRLADAAGRVQRERRRRIEAA